MGNITNINGVCKKQDLTPYIGYFCGYVPVELIHAAGFTPVRLLQGPPPGEVAGRYMQPFCCSFARSLLEGLGDGTYAHLSAVVMPHTCDTIRNLSDLVGSAAPRMRVLRLMVPTVTHTSEAADFMLAETGALKEALEELAGEEVSGERLFQSIRLYNRCRNALAGLRALGFDNRTLYSAYLAFQLMDPEDFLDLMGAPSRLSASLEESLSPASHLSCPQPSSPPPPGGKREAPRLFTPPAYFSPPLEGKGVSHPAASRPFKDPSRPDAAGYEEQARLAAPGIGRIKVALVGGPVPQLEFFDLLEEYGLEVVWDDLCTASRFAAGTVRESGDPLRALAERYLRRRPCPTKRDPDNRREEELLAGIAAGGARGVVFVQQAFCEFHSFDYPGLKRRLDAESIPSVRLDLEHPFAPTGQMRTRLQALSEMMSEGR